MSPEQIISGYEQRADSHNEQYRLLSRRHYQLGLARLMCLAAAAAAGWLYYRSGSSPYIVAAVAAATVFLRLIRVQQHIQQQRRISKELALINSEESAYLREGKLPFADGSNFRDPKHPYSGDLDLFGPNSLYQHLNRNASVMGEQALADSLLRRLPAGLIVEKQAAVAEMTDKLDQRQQLYATARAGDTSAGQHEGLRQWATTPETPIPKTLRILSWVLPALLFAAIAIRFISGDNQWGSLISSLVVINLALFFLQLKRIRKTMAGTEQAAETLAAYAVLFGQIEMAAYESPYLQALQQRLRSSSGSAGTHIRQLAAICRGMEQLGNPFAAAAMNGLYLYHLHMYHRLICWKQAYGTQIGDWLQVIGSMEALNSLANQKYNNPGFCFPRLNTTGAVQFTALGHPLIPQGKRVGNDIQFTPQHFVILTGSNMSGKSTFLRSLGINMVLAGCGAAICASAADIQPMDLYVSMRQSDSLADNESYFFAEVKRLQYIISRLPEAPSFVLLDEILRGTNSDDKRSGTIGVIEKLLRTSSSGIIATHDLEVCQTTTRYPGRLSNKCFEVRISPQGLSFDYMIRDGICHNKSATFLMEQMGIIDPACA